MTTLPVFCHKTWIVGALLLKHILGFMPSHHRLQHGVQEPTVPQCLILRARYYRI